MSGVVHVPLFAVTRLVSKLVKDTQSLKAPPTAFTDLSNTIKDVGVAVNAAKGDTHAVTICRMHEELKLIDGILKQWPKTDCTKDIQAYNLKLKTLLDAMKPTSSLSSSASSVTQTSTPMTVSPTEVTPVTKSQSEQAQTVPTATPTAESTPTIPVPTAPNTSDLPSTETVTTTPTIPPTTSSPMPTPTLSPHLSPTPDPIATSASTPSTLTYIPNDPTPTLNKNPDANLTASSSVPEGSLSPKSTEPISTPELPSNLNTPPHVDPVSSPSASSPAVTIGSEPTPPLSASKQEVNAKDAIFLTYTPPVPGVDTTVPSAITDSSTAASIPQSTTPNHNTASSAEAEITRTPSPTLCIFSQTPVTTSLDVPINFMPSQITDQDGRRFWLSLFGEKSRDVTEKIFCIALTNHCKLTNPQKEQASKITGRVYVGTLEKLMRKFTFQGVLGLLNWCNPFESTIPVTDKVMFVCGFLPGVLQPWNNSSDVGAAVVASNLCNASQDQLWTFKNHHIINCKSKLALTFETILEIEPGGCQRIVLRTYDPESELQQWSFEKDGSIRSVVDPKRLVDIDRDSSVAILWFARPGGLKPNQTFIMLPHL
ncbi:hypothetical protein Pelo_6341 [Pelomyxa schiedti]|nr:hypothetical protein Pelo_6341 [Pelomyxa schiedti]